MPEPIIMKTCPKCNTQKTTSEFYRNKSKTDGLSGWCKTCHSSTCHTYQKTQHYLAYRRRARQSPARKAVRIAYEHRPDVMERRRKQALKAYYKYPLKAKAKKSVYTAIAQGLLSPLQLTECVICGARPDDYHHWNGYEKAHRLDVIPMCVRCHKAIHRRDGHQQYQNCLDSLTHLC